jgi:Domain of unknown function (DUF4359)
MKTANLVALLIVLATAVILAATNPTTQQYTVFLNASLVRALDRMEEQETSRERQIIRDVLKAEGKKVIESLARTNTVRKNFGLFSLFETNAFGIRVQVLGIASRFVPLENEKDLSTKLGRLIL